MSVYDGQKRKDEGTDFADEPGVSMHRVDGHIFVVMFFDEVGSVLSLWCREAVGEVCVNGESDQGPKAIELVPKHSQRCHKIPEAEWHTSSSCCSLKMCRS
jgi:hypothetical protein